MVFAESQFYANPWFYARWLASIFLFVFRHQVTGPWRAVVVFPDRSYDFGDTMPYDTLIRCGSLHRVYLNDLPGRPGLGPGARLARLVVIDREPLLTEARALIDEQTAAELRWTWVDDAARKSQPHQGEVEHRVAAHLAHQARYDATSANREGDLKRARKTLRDAAKRIRDCGGKDSELLDLAAELETEVERHRQTLSSREAKAAVYGSRNPLRGRGEQGDRIRDQAAPTQHEPTRLEYLPCQDGPQRAERCRTLGKITRQQAAALGQSAVTAMTAGTYPNSAGRPVHWGTDVAVAAKLSLPADAILPQD